MHPYALCPSCGFPIFRVQQQYEIMRAAKFKNAEILPDNSRTNTDIDMTTEDILTELGVNKVCCRMHLSTGTRFIYDIFSINPVLPNSEPESSDIILGNSSPKSATIN